MTLLAYIARQVDEALSNASLENMYVHDYERIAADVVAEIHDWSGILEFDENNPEHVKAATDAVDAWRKKTPGRVLLMGSSCHDGWHGYRLAKKVSGLVKDLTRRVDTMNDYDKRIKDNDDSMAHTLGRMRDLERKLERTDNELQIALGMVDVLMQERDARLPPEQIKGRPKRAVG